MAFISILQNEQDTFPKGGFVQSAIDIEMFLVDLPKGQTILRIFRTRTIGFGSSDLNFTINRGWSDRTVSPGAWQAIRTTHFDEEKIRTFASIPEVAAFLWKKIGA